MGAGKILTEQAQFAQTVGGHEMVVINERPEHFAGAVDAEGACLDEHRRS